MLSYNLDLEPLGPCKSKLLKQSESSHSQMFFKIVSLKNLAIVTGKHLCWGLFLIKLQAFRPETLFKKDSNTGVSCQYCKIFKSSNLIKQLWWLLLTVLPQYRNISWGVCSLVSCLHVLSILIKTLHKTLHK